MPIPNGHRRLMFFVERSSQRNTGKPQLDPETEAKLEDSDRIRAACYASMEDLTDRLERVAEELDSNEHAIPIAIDEGDDSLVVMVDKALADRPR